MYFYFIFNNLEKLARCMNLNYAILRSEFNCALNDLAQIGLHK